MAIVVAKFDYQKRDVTIREYQVDDDFLEFVHMLKDNGSSQYNSLAYKITDPIVNSFSDSAGIGWDHDHGTMFGMARNKQAAVDHLYKNAEESGNMDEEELGWLSDAIAKATGQTKQPPEDDKQLSDEDKNKLRGQAGISRK